MSLAGWCEFYSKFLCSLYFQLQSVELFPAEAL